MADVTFGVKVTPDIKEKIDQMIKEAAFETNKEWFMHMLSVYDMHNLKNQDVSKKYSSDLEYIQQNLTRVQDTIVQMMKKTADDVNHLQAESERSNLIQQEALEKSELQAKELETALQESKVQMDNIKNDQREIIKQNGVFEELASTLKKTLMEKDAENVELKNQVTKWASANYTETIQRKSEEFGQLQHEHLALKHQIDLIRLEYEKKLEIEQLKTQHAKEQVEMLLVKKGPGRPRNHLNQGPNDLQTNEHEVSSDMNKEDDASDYLPEDPSDLEELIGEG